MPTYSADRSGRAVKGMNCLRPLKHWDRGFESHLRYGCPFAFILRLCSPVWRQRPCDRLIPLPRSPTDCVKIKKLKKRPRSNKGL
jgi:hypothetical protein